MNDARRRPDTAELPIPHGVSLLELVCSGFAWSQVVCTAVELGIFDALEPEADQQTLAQRTGLPREPLSRMLSALTALGLVEPKLREGGTTRYRLSPLASASLTRTGRRSMVPVIVQTHRHFYELFANLPAAVRTGRPQLGRWSFHRPGAKSCYDALAERPAEYAVLLEAMEASSAGVAEFIAERIDLASARHLVDLGHGGGRVARELMATHPKLSVTAVDLPPAIAFARRRAEAAALGQRIRFVEADLREPLHGVDPADAVLLSGVVSDFEPEARAKLIDRAYRLLVPGGRVLVSETLFDEGRHGPATPALLSLCMLLLTGGDNFTPREITALLAATGFADIRVDRGGDRGVRDLVCGRRPGTAVSG